MKFVRAGRLDQRIRIQQKTNARGPLGGHQETWADLASVWAEIRDMSGKEIFTAKAMGSEASQMITIRYRTDVTPAMRVMFSDGSLARIEWVRRVTRREYMELYCLTINV